MNLLCVVLMMSFLHRQSRLDGIYHFTATRKINLAPKKCIFRTHSKLSSQAVWSAKILETANYL